MCRNILKMILIKMFVIPFSLSLGLIRYFEIQIQIPFPFKKKYYFFIWLSLSLSKESRRITVAFKILKKMASQHICQRIALFLHILPLRVFKVMQYFSLQKNR